VAVATLAAALRVPLASPVARGPGRWLALRPQDAFVPAPCRAHWLDAGSRVGRACALLCAALVLAASVAAHRFDVEGPWLVALDAAPLVPLFTTGLACQLPPHAGRSAAPWLARAFDSLRAVQAIRVAPWGRVTDAGDAPTAHESVDELRLLVLPRAAMPGVVGIELGLAWSSTPVGYGASPEVLARVLDGSPAAAKLAVEIGGVAVMSGARVFPGRRPNERVAVLLPRAPTRASALSLVRAVAAALTDRRMAFPAPGRGGVWTAPDRRAQGVATNPSARHENWGNSLQSRSLGACYPIAHASMPSMCERGDATIGTPRV
jgi:hypothetical protein